MGERYAAPAQPSAGKMTTFKYQSAKDRLKGTEPTNRELEVCKLISEGLTREEVGRALFITKGTVDNHMRRIHLRLEAKTTIGVIARLIREGKI